MVLFENIMTGEKTDKGHKRKNNEDNYIIVDPNDPHIDVKGYGLLFAVADGMGGHAAGETASRMACKGLLNAYYEGGHENVESPAGLPGHLERAVQGVNRALYKFTEHNTEYAGMGTTLSVVVFVKAEAIIAHVGDSRIYRLRDDVLEQLTPDHTQARAMVEMGRMTPEQAKEHPLRHMLTQAVGTEPELEEVFTRAVTVREGDLFLLSSDGLYDMVPDGAIASVLREIPSPQAACDRLVEMALEAGGEDNVTVLVVRV
jgi:PPM family protein phosphatase